MNNNFDRCQAEYDARLPDEYWDSHDDVYCGECGWNIEDEGHSPECSQYIEEGDEC